jgi:glycosyltransferase involved in cell wall biosynthesis/SAM-dependent methyltransferase
MRLAYFSPLNPQPSGISDYSEELLPYLAAEADITLFVDGFEPSNPEIRERFTCYDYRRDPSVLKTLDTYDAIVYHIGNDHRYHAGMLEVARKHPGIVVFHDFALQDFFLGLAQERSRVEIYLDEVFACHGRRATREAAEALERGTTPPQAALPLEFPLNCRFARAAEGIVVHSEFCRARFAKSVPSVPVAHINMPIKPLPARHAKESNGNATVIQIANFGLITPGKGIEKALRTLSSLKADHNFHYTLVGEPNSFFDVRALVRQYDMEGRVTITGHLRLEEFERWIAATDIALNLRERTVGETSASLCRLMAAGVPTIVSNVGAFAELPDDAIIKIDQDENAEALLEAYLRRLIEDDGLRQRIGANAQRYIAENHAIKIGAANYLAFIREVIARRPRKQFLNGVAHEITALGIRENDDTLLRGVAREVAALAPAANYRTATRRGNERMPDPTLPGGPKQTEIHSTMRFREGNGQATSSQASPDSPGRLPKLEGIDYKRAALEYPKMLDAERSHYLRTKPFYNLANKPDKHLGDGMDAETHRHFTDFANMASALALPPGATILDVGCGSGWLSEYFARLGYDVTGIDISDELIAMARDRVERVPYDVDHETELRCRFLAQDIESAPLPEKFDAVICYDSLHHFEDERKVFRHLAAMLDVGGLLFILEGHKPSAGSATEDELQDVMRKYGTLESPFSGDYLRALLDEHGLAVVGDYVSVNGLFEREMLEADRLPLRSLATDYHYLTCIKVAEGAPASSVPDSRKPGVLRADFKLTGPLARRVEPDEKISATITIRNTGDTLWLSGQTLRAGIVMPGVRVFDQDGKMVSEVHGHPMLPRSIAPGQYVAITLPCPVPAVPGTYTVKIDLVDQQVCWFEERGSQPLIFNIEVVGKMN